MSKRFTDSEKWDDSWFFNLKDKDKLLWIYILDKCNHAGIFRVNLPAINLYLEGNYTIQDIKDILKNRVYSINGEKFFVKKFIDFQYGVLNDNNRVHNSVIEILKKEGLFKVYKRGLIAPKEQDKDKDKVKDKEKEERFEEIYKKYPNTDGGKMALKHFMASVNTDKDWANINKALTNYLSCQKVKDGFVKNASTWFNNWKDWIEFNEAKKLQNRQRIRTGSTEFKGGVRVGG